MLEEHYDDNEDHHANGCDDRQVDEKPPPRYRWARIAHVSSDQLSYLQRPGGLPTNVMSVNHVRGMASLCRPIVTALPRALPAALACGRRRSSVRSRS